MHLFRHIALAAALLVAPVGHAGTVTVFAAASLKTALDEVAGQWRAETGHDVVLAYAGSSALARQIGQGAPADLFISANAAWMDHLDGQGLLQPQTRRDLLGNTLVLVGTEAGNIDLTDTGALLTALGDGPLAMGFTNAVPAGIYGKQALSSLGHWQALQGRIVETDSARAALALVARAEAPLGVVYGSDARAEPRVHARALFPPGSHAPITYPVAALSDTAETRALLAYLGSPPAQSVFRANGFTVSGGS